ncbi:hypothetical protein ACLGI4_14460 [Streptomyces sp. HMX112]|uniref:hypothetical protein n=1 Tax=Streptomyces sp. HMX112 TaxID=3390850 RepID=UPI003A807C17
MTSTSDTTQHPDVSEISDLTEGLLSPSHTADVRRHLDGCVLCADVLASLEEIRGLLGTLPGPPRMPADVAGRIDAALAAEALLDATTSTGPNAVSRETAPAPLAAVTGHSDRPAGRPRAATGPGRRTALRRRRNAVLGAVFGAAAVGVSVLFLQTGRPAQNDTAARKADSTVSAAEDSTFSGTDLRGRVETLLAAEAGKPAPRTKQAPSLQGEKLHEVDLPPCIRAGTGRTDAALAAETGQYQGERAYLVVLPHLSDAAKVEAYVLDAACTTTGSSAKADVLLKHAYPRP